jgi:hypothetical protein
MTCVFVLKGSNGFRVYSVCFQGASEIMQFAIQVSSKVKYLIS